jgi:hypothetical protein
LADARSFEPILQKAKALRPPREFASYNDALVDLLEGEVRSLGKWGEAIGSGNRQAAEEAMRRVGTHETEALRRLLQAAVKLASTNPSLAKHAEELKAQLAGMQAGPS